MTNFLNLYLKNKLLKIHPENYNKQCLVIDSEINKKFISKIMNSVW
jgi:hypothetical protein